MHCMHEKMNNYTQKLQKILDFVYYTMYNIAR